MTGCRIGKIKMKDSGLSVFRPPERTKVNESFVNLCLSSSRDIKEIDGYVIIAWDKSGNNRTHYHTGSSDIFDLPAKVSEMIKWVWRK